jgi:hypothetical protein
MEFWETYLGRKLGKKELAIHPLADLYVKLQKAT